MRLLGEQTKVLQQRNGFLTHNVAPLSVPQRPKTSKPLEPMGLNKIEIETPSLQHRLRLWG